MGHGEDLIGIIAPAIIILIVLLAIIVGFVAAARRRNAFMELAKRHGWKYHRKSRGIPKQFDFLNVVAQGHSRYAENILDGMYENRKILVFDYHYATGSGKNEQHHYLNVFMLSLERPFPECRIYPENLFSKFGQMIGFEDIDFESVEFSNAFTVRAANKKFAYDICHTRMMEYLLQHPKTLLEIESNWICTWSASRVDIEQIIPTLNTLLEVRSLFPKYLFT